MAARATSKASSPYFRGEMMGEIWTFRHGRSRNLQGRPWPYRTYQQQGAHIPQQKRRPHRFLCACQQGVARIYIQFPIIGQVGGHADAGIDADLIHLIGQTGEIIEILQGRLAVIPSCSVERLDARPAGAVVCA